MRTIVPEKDNPVLRQVALDIPVADIKSARIKSLIKEMKTLLMREEFGVALAAPQVGEAVKLFIVSGRALARDSRNSAANGARSRARKKRQCALTTSTASASPAAHRDS